MGPVFRGILAVMSTQKPVMLSGIKPTGELHIGNYFGAMRQIVELAKSREYRPFVMVADYHALNTMQDAVEMRRRTEELVAGYLAAGLDGDDIVLFKQSDVSAHTELAWIFDTITTMPYLMRAHAFKAHIQKIQDLSETQVGSVIKTSLLRNWFKPKEERSKYVSFDVNLERVLKSLAEISVGTFNYPVLMAADILLYDTKVVPVGQDQKQHIEYARDIAEKFNHVFKTETFKLPESRILPEVAIVPGTDGQKMSKSYGNVIPLFASREEIIKRVMGIVTDSGGERPENVYAIHKLIKSEEELAPLYTEHAGKYKALKEALIEDLDAFIAPMRTRYESLMQDTEAIRAVLTKGAEIANIESKAKMLQVKAAIGVN